MLFIAHLPEIKYNWVMMKKFALLFICFFMLGLALQTGWVPRLFNLPMPFKRGETVHVFFEPYATNPALSEMVEFARLPKSARKLIAWHRFANRKNVIDLKEYNAEEINIPPKEGYYGYSTQKVLERVLQIYLDNPETRFVFYVNLTHQNVTLVPFLKVLPQENIAHIHLFEDGYGEFFKQAHVYTNNNRPFDAHSVKKLPDAHKGLIPWETVFNISIHKLYPATYHIMHADKMDDEPQLKYLYAWLKDAPIEQIDFDELRETMTEEQKQTVYKLAGFDYKKFYPLLHGKPTVLYTFGFTFGHTESEQAELNLLTALKTGKLMPLKGNKPYQWFYKSHPSLKAKHFSEELNALFPDMIEIPAQVPFEVLILADCKPTLTAGFGSSLFYSLNAEDVLAYVKRSNNDHYLKFLAKYNLVKPNQILNLTDFIDHAPDE